MCLNDEEQPLGGRKVVHEDVHELCNLVKGWKQLARSPSRNEALTREHISLETNGEPDSVCYNADALEYISTIRAVAYRHPPLVIRVCEFCPEAPKSATEGCKVRNAEHMMFMGLSRYYRVAGNEEGDGEEGKDVVVWDREHLLKEGKLEPDHLYRTRDIPLTCISLSSG
jgi:hypothetical protein